MKGMLSCKTLFGVVKTSFSKIKDIEIRKRTISLTDCLLSGYAVFSLKYSSLLQFDNSYREDTTKHNLKQVYGINQAPSDTQMRERLDTVDPKHLRSSFTKLFAQCQRSKYLSFFEFFINSLEDLWLSLAYGHQGADLTPHDSS